MHQYVQRDRTQFGLTRALHFQLLLVALLCATVLPGQVGDIFSGPVVGVEDGDTISVMRDGKTVRIRFDGINSPETDQAFATRATAFTSSRVLNKCLTVSVRDVDRYGRLVSRVQVDGVDDAGVGLALHAVFR